MDGSYIATRVKRAVNFYGSTVTLRRRVGTSSTFIEAEVKATRKQYQPTEGVRMSEIPGDMESGDEIFTVSALDLVAKSWPGPPVKGDFLVSRGKTWAVLGAGVKEVGDVTCAWLIHARGG